jgi:UDP-GlcNAc:undecaprenyl-phosphate/decaprenyl-phosphate GlcNAc-1-phosphate transferase
MMLSGYLLCFMVSALLSLILTHRVQKIATTRGWVQAPELVRHVHVRPVPRLGGVAIFLSFVTVAGFASLAPKLEGLVPVSHRTMLTVFIAALVIFLAGLYDDVRSVGPYWKFTAQTVAAVILWDGGIGIRRLDLISSGHPLGHALGLAFTIVWVLLITNAFNLIDGLDGLAAGSAFFSTAILFITSLFVPHPTVTLLTSALGGVILGFLRFNFYPASIFLGDSGSMFIGFMLSALALMGSEKAPTMVAVAIPVICFGFPILEVSLAVSRRFLSGKPLFRGDGDHIHHRLLKRGLSQQVAVTVLYGVTAVFALLSLALLHDATLIAFVLVLVGVGIGCGLHYLRYAEFSELRNVLRRTMEQKRTIVNNVEIRHAVESLDACIDWDGACDILQRTLRCVGFDGFRLENLPFGRLTAHSNGQMNRPADEQLKVCWGDFENKEMMWEMKLDLCAEPRHRLGQLALLRFTVEGPLLVDVNLLSREFRVALSKALLRAATQSVSTVRNQTSAASAASAKAVSVSSSD